MWWSFFVRGGADKLAEKIKAQKQQKREDEETAFADAKIEDIEFVVGTGSYLIPVVLSLTLFVIIFIVKESLEDYYVMDQLPDKTQAIIMAAFIGFWLLLSAGLLLYTFLRPPMGVVGKDFYYKKLWYSCDQIFEIRITPMSRILIYVDNKRLASYSWNETNAEKLIAWARKCGVSVKDDRIAFSTERIENSILFRDLFEKKPVKRAVSVALPDVPEALEIAEEQFLNRTDLTEFRVPHGTTKIGRNAFKGCINLEKITLPSTLKEIGSSAFADCSALQTINIPDSVTSIGEYAFESCRMLSRFRFPRGMRGAELRVGLFYDCLSLETAELPDRLSKSFTNIFPHCESLCEIHLPKGITTIGSFAFQGCIQLKTIAIPSTVREIEYKAFVDAAGLEEMYIPDTVKVIDAYETFGDCTALKKIRLPIDVTFRHVFKDKDADDAVGCCFSGCISLETVILGDKEFQLDGPLNDAALQKLRKQSEA